MRRITLAVLGTVSILVMLLSYRTSLGGGTVALPAQTAHVVTGSASTPAAAAGPDPAGSSSGSNGAASSGGADSAGSAGGGTTNDEPADPTSGATPSAATPSGRGNGSTSGAAAGSAAAGDQPIVADGTTQLTEHGPVEVQVTIEGGRITAATAVQYPDSDPRSQQINAVALPQLSAEVIDAQGANIDVVSGATETTDGYVASLQSALDAAHFAAARP